nr:MAG TPA: hypothetical protein [Caudoviricetes sp.]
MVQSSCKPDWLLQLGLPPRWVLPTPGGASLFGCPPPLQCDKIR